MTATLALRAPASCPGAAALAAAVTERVGRLAFVDEAADLQVEVRMRRGVIGWHANVVTRSRDGEVLGERDLEEPSPDCRAALGPLALVVALVIDAPTVRRAARAAPAQTEVDLGLRGRVAVGRTPLWSGGIGLYGALALADFLALRMDVTASLPGAEGAPPGALDAWGGDAGLSLCPRVDEGPFRLDLCGGAAAGFVRASGVGFDVDESTTAATVDVAVWARPGLKLDALHVGLGVGVGLGVLRPTFVSVSAAGDVPRYEPSLVWGEVELTLGVALD